MLDWFRRRFSPRVYGYEGGDTIEHDITELISYMKKYGVGIFHAVHYDDFERIVESKEIAFPSIGITKLTSHFTEFGEIIFVPSLAVLKDPNTYIFDRDAYTPRYGQFAQDLIEFDVATWQVLKQGIIGMVRKVVSDEYTRTVADIKVPAKGEFAWVDKVTKHLDDLENFLSERPEAMMKKGAKVSEFKNQGANWKDISTPKIKTKLEIVGSIIADCVKASPASIEMLEKPLGPQAKREYDHLVQVFDHYAQKGADIFTAKFSLTSTATDQIAKLLQESIKYSCFIGRKMDRPRRVAAARQKYKKPHLAVAVEQHTKPPIYTVAAKHLAFNDLPREMSKKLIMPVDPTFNRRWEEEQNITVNMFTVVQQKAWMPYGRVIDNKGVATAIAASELEDIVSSQPISPISTKWTMPPDDTIKSLVNMKSFSPPPMFQLVSMVAKSKSYKNFEDAFLTRYRQIYEVFAVIYGNVDLPVTSARKQMRDFFLDNCKFYLLRGAPHWDTYAVNPSPFDDALYERAGLSAEDTDRIRTFGRAPPKFFADVDGKSVPVGDALWISENAGRLVMEGLLKNGVYLSPIEKGNRDAYHKREKNVTLPEPYFKMMTTREYLKQFYNDVKKWFQEECRITYFEAKAMNIMDIDDFPLIIIRKESKSRQWVDNLVLEHNYKGRVMEVQTRSGTGNENAADPIYQKYAGSKTYEDVRAVLDQLDMQNKILYKARLTNEQLVLVHETHNGSKTLCGVDLMMRDDGGNLIGTANVKFIKDSEAIADITKITCPKCRDKWIQIYESVVTQLRYPLHVLNKKTLITPGETVSTWCGAPVDWMQVISESQHEEASREVDKDILNRVCEKCTTAWMEDIQKNAKPELVEKVLSILGPTPTEYLEKHIGKKVDGVVTLLCDHNKKDKSDPPWDPDVYVANVVLDHAYGNEEVFPGVFKGVIQGITCHKCAYKYLKDLNFSINGEGVIDPDLDQLTKDVYEAMTGAMPPDEKYEIEKLKELAIKSSPPGHVQDNNNAEMTLCHQPIGDLAPGDGWISLAAASSDPWKITCPICKAMFEDSMQKLFDQTMETMSKKHVWDSESNLMTMCEIPEKAVPHGQVYPFSFTGKQFNINDITCEKCKKKYLELKKYNVIHIQSKKTNNKTLCDTKLSLVGDNYWSWMTTDNLKLKLEKGNLCPKCVANIDQNLTLNHIFGGTILMTACGKTRDEVQETLDNIWSEDVAIDDPTIINCQECKLILFKKMFDAGITAGGIKIDPNSKIQKVYSKLLKLKGKVPDVDVTFHVYHQNKLLCGEEITIITSFKTVDQVKLNPEKCNCLNCLAELIKMEKAGELDEKKKVHAAVPISEAHPAGASTISLCNIPLGTGAGDIWMDFNDALDDPKMITCDECHFSVNHIKEEKESEEKKKTIIEPGQIVHIAEETAKGAKAMCGGGFGAKWKNKIMKLDQNWQAHKFNPKAKSNYKDLWMSKKDAITNPTVVTCKKCRAAFLGEQAAELDLLEGALADEPE